MIRIVATREREATQNLLKQEVKLVTTRITK